MVMDQYLASSDSCATILRCGDSHAQMMAVPSFAWRAILA
jgi:hypothetical protein